MMGKMGLEPILPVKVPIIVCTMLNFDGDGDGVSTCKQTFKVLIDQNK